MDSKLASKDILINRSLSGNTRFLGAGLWLEAVARKGNRNSSIEEADLILSTIKNLVSGDVHKTVQIQMSISSDEVSKSH